MNWRYSVAVLGEKILQNDQSVLKFCFSGCKKVALSLIWHNFCVMWRKALIMQMQMIANYTVSCCPILSDALLREEKT